MTHSPRDLEGGGGEGDRVDQNVSADEAVDETSKPTAADITADDMTADEADRIEQAASVGEADEDYPWE